MCIWRFRHHTDARTHAHTCAVTATDELKFSVRALVQRRPSGVSVGVSERALEPGGKVRFIQLLFHVTELL